MINLDFIQFYQLFIKADLIIKELFIISINNTFVIYGQKYISRVSRFNGGWNRLLSDYNLIEIFNLIGSSSTDSLDLLFYKYTLDLKDIELYVGDNIRRLYFL